MAKVYYRKYKARIESGELTPEEAIALVETEVPDRWRQEVITMLMGEN